MSSVIKVAVVGVAILGMGCTAKLDPAQMARLDAASNSATAAATKCQAAADQATSAATRAAESANSADRAARKAEAIFGTSLRK